MAKYSSSFIELAARGAKARYDELQAEVAALIRQFPSLPGGRGDAAGRGRRRSKRAMTTASEAAVPRRRRQSNMSAAARKAVSERMKKYWAGRRKAKGAKK
jgi:hypothetical protein